MERQGLLVRLQIVEAKTAIQEMNQEVNLGAMYKQPSNPTYEVWE